MQSESGQRLVPNWRREFHNAELYFERSENDDYDENIEGEREEWMHLADLCANNNQTVCNDTIDSHDEYWQSS